MADDLPEEDDFLDRDGEFRVGAKVIEMCDRVLVAHKCAPGAQAKWFFEIDDCRFEVTVKVVEPG